MLSPLVFIGVLALPFLGATLVTPSRALARAPISLVVGGLLLWLLLVWSIALSLVAPFLASALRELLG